MVVSWHEAISNAAEQVTAAGRLSTSSYSEKKAEMATERANAWTRIAEAINRREAAERFKL